MEGRQVKSKQRVADHGEVFTNEREVKAMVDLVWKNLEQGTTDKVLTATFLEPSCGSGNFLIEILRRKISLLKAIQKNKLDYDFSLVLVAGSLYGVELLPDNTQECRERLFAEFQKSYPKKFIERNEDHQKLMKSVQFIISQNIICGDALSYTTPEGEPILFTHWSGLLSTREIIANYFDYGEKANVKGGMLSLFAEQTVKAPITKHFLELGTE
ncbi:hypothetical protein [Capnocytophaga canimorsus]|uniref:hypothetical protein n=1 Tax=Capnocytophaga canimorsus TaxID=28188 RepID=UPI000F6E3C55|nr:hypothetical protein [Capnocytophaga canimorsus]VEJ18223.1 Uncharacterised protein [Capnocytophaga canimorsus]